MGLSALKLNLLNFDSLINSDLAAACPPPLPSQLGLALPNHVFIWAYFRLCLLLTKYLPT